MTCGLHSKFETAVDGVKEAFKQAVDTKDFDRSTLSEVWRHYQGLQTILEGLPKHEEHDSISFEGITLPDGCYDPDYNITFDKNDLAFDAAQPVTFPVASDSQSGGEDKIVL
tara:strand:- start:8 stop:343 length:336 start_codon:yes stop_codon:yes gene_type:complete